MELKELVDIDGLKCYISEVGVRTAIAQAKDMAYELASTESSKRAVHSMYQIYNELGEAELDAERGVMAIDAMFGKLATEEEKRCFCSYGYPKLRI